MISYFITIRSLSLCSDLQLQTLPAQNGHIEAVRLLLAAGANSTCSIVCMGRTAKQWAILRMAIVTLRDCYFCVFENKHVLGDLEATHTAVHAMENEENTPIHVAPTLVSSCLTIAGNSWQLGPVGSLGRYAIASCSSMQAFTSTGAEVCSSQPNCQPADSQNSNTMRSSRAAASMRIASWNCCRKGGCRIPAVSNTRTWSAIGMSAGWFVSTTRSEQLTNSAWRSDIMTEAVTGLHTTATRIGGSSAGHGCIGDPGKRLHFDDRVRASSLPARNHGADKPRLGVNMYR
jgi:hypothetical protein